jgi:hypothetical protein
MVTSPDRKYQDTRFVTGGHDILIDIRDSLIAQVGGAEQGFRESRSMPWDEVKRRTSFNNLIR